VARLLGDLVAYRASGTGHLELLAGWLSVSVFSYQIYVQWPVWMFKSFILPRFDLTRINVLKLCYAPAQRCA
jgi:hypothetical protein